MTIPSATRHPLGARPPQTVIIEPRPGGRWFERANDGFLSHAVVP